MLKTLVSACVFTVLAFTSTTAHAQPQQPASGTYQWSGEFVSFDDAAKTITVKSRLAYQHAVDELKRFKPGDRVLLLWSGYDTYADAIREVKPSTGTPKTDERFLLPVELVSTEIPNQYVTFRLPVPEGSAGTLKMMKPGEWVTVTSPHHVLGESAPVAAIRPYTATAGQSD